MSGKAVRRAYDAQGGVSLAAPMPGRRAVVVPGVRSMPVRAALEWAFGVEHARIDFDDAGGWSVGSDCVWRLMQRKALGCAVDGGGRSASHPDAEVIASFVAGLPPGCGGRGMALRVAELARAGIAPDWMRDARPACVPKRWRNTRHGVFAATEVVGTVQTVHRGRRIVRDVVCCPVTYVPTAQQIAAARREWLAWVGALLHIGAMLRASGRLQTIRVTQDLPPLTPWLQPVRQGLCEATMRGGVDIQKVNV